MATEPNKTASPSQYIQNIESNWFKFNYCAFRLINRGRTWQVGQVMKVAERLFSALLPFIPPPQPRIVPPPTPTQQLFSRHLRADGFTLHTNKLAIYLSIFLPLLRLLAEPPVPNIQDDNPVDADYPRMGYEYKHII